MMTFRQFGPKVQGHFLKRSKPRLRRTKQCSLKHRHGEPMTFLWSDRNIVQRMKWQHGPEASKDVKEPLIISSPVNHGTRHGGALSTALPVFEEFQPGVIKEGDARG